jgi:N-acetylneuraminic acid mutarotase
MMHHANWFNLVFNQIKLVVVYLLLCLQTSSGQTWLQLSDFPGTERDDGISFVIGNTAYCGTGFKTGFVTSGDMYALDLTNDSWSSNISSLPSGMERQYATSFSNANYGFVFGGIGSSGYYNDLWRYSPANNSWLAMNSIPSFARAGACSFVLNDTAYIVGGSTPILIAVNEFWAYSIQSDTWTFKGVLPFGGRWRASAVACNGKGYLIFGKDVSSLLRNELLEFDPITNLWTQISNFPNAGRVYSSVQTLNGDLLIFAGLDSLSNSYNDLWRYSIATSTWKQLQSLPALGRRGGMCFASSSSLYYTTGINQNNTRLKETWKVVNPTSINENTVEEIFDIYPNPFTDGITLNFRKVICLNEIIILNSMGQTVKSITVKSKIDKIDLMLEDLYPGIYLLQCSSNAHLFLRKIVKQ